MPASPPLGSLSTGASCLNVTTMAMSAHAYAMLHDFVFGNRMHVCTPQRQWQHACDGAACLTHKQEGTFLYIM